MAKGKLALGLDIGSSGVKLIQLKEQRRRGEVTYALHSFGMKPLPPEAIVDGALMNSTAIVQAIQELLAVSCGQGCTSQAAWAVLHRSSCRCSWP